MLKPQGILHPPPCDCPLEEFFHTVNINHLCIALDQQPLCTEQCIVHPRLPFENERQLRLPRGIDHIQDGSSCSRWRAQFILTFFFAHTCLRWMLSSMESKNSCSSSEIWRFVLLLSLLPHQEFTPNKKAVRGDVRAHTFVVEDAFVVVRQAA